MLTLRGTELQFLLGQRRELPPLSFLIITLMCQADAPCGLVQPLACSCCSGQLKLATVLEFFQYLFSDSFGDNP
ncbi:hypothetical protein ACGGZ2_004434, partial [Salmonella enterica]